MIERALAQDFSIDLRQRELQFEAKAHIEVQREIDRDNSIDQVQFMRSCLEPSQLLARIEVYLREEVFAKRLLPGSDRVVVAVFRFSIGRRYANGGTRSRSGGGCQWLSGAAGTQGVAAVVGSWFVDFGYA